MAEKILFLDRDGTLIHEPDDFQVDALDKIQLVDDVIPSLLEIARHGYRFVMVSNQDGLGTDAFPQSDFDAPHALIMQLFTSQGIEFDEILICPHLPEDSCDCRKPRTGLLTRFLAANDIDLAASAVIGDRQTDMQLAENIGVRGLLVNCDDPPAITWPHRPDRQSGFDEWHFDQYGHRLLRPHAGAGCQTWRFRAPASVHRRSRR